MFGINGGPGVAETAFGGSFYIGKRGILGALKNKNRDYMNEVYGLACRQSIGVYFEGDTCRP